MLKLILIREGRKNIITNIRRKTKYVIGREKLSKTEKLQRYAKCRRNLIPRFLVNKLIKLATMYVSRFKICHTFDYKRKKNTNHSMPQNTDITGTKIYVLCHIQNIKTISKKGIFQFQNKFCKFCVYMIIYIQKKN